MPPAPTSWIERIGLPSPSAEQRSITSWQRRCISALSRCTDAKSRSSCDDPDASDDAAPPPRPISIAGPPSTTSARARRNVGLLHVLGADVAEAARDHDRLVIAVAPRRSAVLLDLHLEACGSSRQVRAAELVVERGAAQRRLDHDLQRARDPVGLAVVLLPRAHGAGQAQVRHREAGQPRLRARAPPRRPLVADLAARAGGRARKRRDRRRVVVGLDLHHDVHRLARARRRRRSRDRGRSGRPRALR